VHFLPLPVVVMQADIDGRDAISARPAWNWCIAPFLVSTIVILNALRNFIKTELTHSLGAIALLSRFCDGTLRNLSFSRCGGQAKRHTQLIPLGTQNDRIHRQMPPTPRHRPQQLHDTHHQPRAPGSVRQHCFGTRKRQRVLRTRDATE
jgi:hypothetical protein